MLSAFWLTWTLFSGYLPGQTVVPRGGVTGCYNDNCYRIQPFVTVISWGRSPTHIRGHTSSSRYFEHKGRACDLNKVAQRATIIVINIDWVSIIEHHTFQSSGHGSLGQIASEYRKLNLPRVNPHQEDFSIPDHWKRNFMWFWTKRLMLLIVCGYDICDLSLVIGLLARDSIATCEPHIPSTHPVFR